MNTKFAALTSLACLGMSACFAYVAVPAAITDLQFAVSVTGSSVALFVAACFAQIALS